MPDDAWRPTFEDLLDQADYATPEQARHLIEQAIELADRHRDEDAGWHARLALIDTCSSLGRTRDAFSAFIWCLTCVDRSPARLAEVEAEAREGRGLYWCYKWVAEDATSVLDLGREQLCGLMADMGRRFDRLSLGAKALQSLHALQLWHLGEEAAAFAAFDDVQHTEQDAISDCPACVLNREIEFMVRRGQHREALAAASPILERRMHCREVPLFTYDALLESCWQERRRETGLEIVRGLLPLLGLPEKILGPAANALIFLVRSGNLTRAVGLLRRTLPRLVDQERTVSGWRYLTAAHLLFARLHDLGRHTVTVADRNNALGWPAGPQAVSAMLALVGRQAEDLSAVFDTRNGNHTFSTRHTRLLADRAEVADWPLG